MENEQPQKHDQLSNKHQRQSESAQNKIHKLTFIQISGQPHPPQNLPNRSQVKFYSEKSNFSQYPRQNNQPNSDQGSLMANMIQEIYNDQKYEELFSDECDHQKQDNDVPLVETPPIDEINCNVEPDSSIKMLLNSISRVVSEVNQLSQTSSKKQRPRAYSILERKLQPSKETRDIFEKNDLEAGIGLDQCLLWRNLMNKHFLDRASTKKKQIRKKCSKMQDQSEQRVQDEKKTKLSANIKKEKTNLITLMKNEKAIPSSLNSNGLIQAIQNSQPQTQIADVHKADTKPQDEIFQESEEDNRMDIEGQTHL